MRNKYMKHDKLNEFNKNISIYENNINYSSIVNIPKTKSTKNNNSIMDKTKPILSRFHRLNQQKEKEKENKDFQIKKINQTNDKEKEQKNKNISKFSKFNINSNTSNNKKLDNNKLENKNSDKKNENIYNNDNKDKNNNGDLLNMKSISIKNKFNYSKLINKIKQKNHLIQTNKNNILSKDNNDYENETNMNKNNNNNDLYNKHTYQKEKIYKNFQENKEKINKIDKTSTSRKNYIVFPTESTLINTEINNNEERNKDNRSESSSFIGNRFPNLNIKPKQSFQFLVHQATKNRDLSNSFHKYYESNKLSRSPSEAGSERGEDYSINSNYEDQSVDKHKFRNLSLLKSNKYNEGDSISSLNININEKKINSITERKRENKIHTHSDDINNIKVFNFNNYNENQIENDINKPPVITNNIINNNVYNTTLNFYKISNNSKSKGNFGSKTKALSSKNIMENDDIIYEDETNMNNINSNRNNNRLANNINNQKEYNNYTQMSQSCVSSGYLLVINLEFIFSLEKRILLLLDKINKYDICDKECLDYIIFFFNNKIYDEEIKIFKNKHNRKNYLYNIKIDILCFFLML